MGVIRIAQDERGQMTIELAVAFPVLIVVAAIAVNAMTFFHDCAVFDRAAREAVRVYAAAPAYGQGPYQSSALIEEAIRAQVSAAHLDVSVARGSAGYDFAKYTATLTYHPTLFGMGLRTEAFGVAMPYLTHETVCVIDEYRPGVIV